MNNFLKIHSSCFIVYGASNGVIYDLRRGVLYPIPNSFLKILQEYENVEFSKLLVDYNAQSAILNKYLNFLFENEIIFLTSTPINFPKINTNFRKPFILDIVLLEIDNFDLTKKKLFQFNTISQIGCSELILISKQDSSKDIEEILKLLNDSKIQSVICLINFDFFSSDTIDKLTNNYLRIREVVVYNCINEIIVDNKIVRFTSDSLQELFSKKISNTDDFVPNLDSYVESQSFNLFFNRRIYIDNDNNVKHSYNDTTVFGNLNKQTINQIISSTNLTSLWKINKDRIKVCKDCEFRYVCPDNRIPVFDKISNLYDHIDQCNYNPYTNQWK